MASSRKNKVISNNLFIPAALSALPHTVEMDKFLEAFGFSGFMNKNSAYKFVCGRLTCSSTYTANLSLGYLSETPTSQGFYESPVRLIYFESDGTIWVAKSVLSMNSNFYQISCRNSQWPSDNRSTRIVFKIGEWKQEKSVSLGATDIFAQRSTELFSILKSTRPYLAEWAVSNCCPYGVALVVPYFETLSKIGYSFVQEFIQRGIHSPLSCAIMNRICQVGTKPKTIFKLPKPVYEALKNESDLKIWDIYRKMVKFGRINPNSIAQAYMLNLRDRELELAHQILGATFENKAVFSWDSLVNYLHRLDMYEAIECGNALTLLRDYLSMCQKMQVQPRVDSDSLRREHDVMARNYRIMASKMRNERVNLGIHEAWEVMSKLDYKEDIFMVRAIQSIEDLNNEASQQRNCVASYANRIIKRESGIFVMREVAHPENSLITIEIDPDSYVIRQKFLACNRPIHNKAQSDFINRWYSYIRKLKAAA